MDMELQQFTTKVTIIGGYAIQALAIIAIGLFVIIRDGVTTGTIIDALTIIAAGNAGMSGVAAIVHTLKAPALAAASAGANAPAPTTGTASMPLTVTVAPGAPAPAPSIPAGS